MQEPPGELSNPEPTTIPFPNRRSEGERRVCAGYWGDMTDPARVGEPQERKPRL